MKLLGNSAVLRGAAFRVGVPLLTLCAGVGGAAVVTALTPPTYQASASVVVTNDSGGEADRTQNPPANTAQALIPTVVRLAQSATVARATADQAHVPLRLVSGHVTASAQPDVQIVTLTARASTPARAAGIANAMARVLNARLVHKSLGGGNTLTVQQLDEAAPPQTPVLPNHLLNAALGGLLGLLGGLGIVSWRTRRDDRLHSPTDVESELGALVLSGVPPLTSWQANRGARDIYHRAGVADSIRMAVATLAAVSPASPCHRLLVTSVRNDDGKALLAALLALGLVEQHEHVTLVEGQLHQPALTRHFPEAVTPTLQEMLASDPLPAQPALPAAPRLSVIAGEPIDRQRSAALFRSEVFPRVLDHLSEASDVLVMHAPPVLGSADFAALARHADAVVLTVKAGSTRTEEARRALHVLQLVGTRMAGVVITDAAEAGVWARRRPDTALAPSVPRAAVPRRPKPDSGSTPAPDNAPARDSDPAAAHRGDTPHPPAPRKGTQS